MITNYICSTDYIKGIKESNKAKRENNDCVVRAIASAADMDYDTAHEYVKKTFKRKDGKGTYDFQYNMNMMSKNGEKINNKSIEIITEEHNTMCYYVTVKGVKKLRQTTTGSFIKKYPKGNFIIVVNRHAFAIKDGVIIGRSYDGKQLKKHVYNVWKIG